MKSIIRYLLSVTILAGIIFVLLNVPAYWQQVKRLPVIKQPTSNSNSQLAVNTLFIPKLGISVPVTFNAPTDEPRLLKTLETSVAHLSGTAVPGTGTNTVIVGHSSNFVWDRGQYKTIFASLNRLSIGDSIFLRYGDTNYQYQVGSERVVAATDLSPLLQSGAARLTLITCTPIGTTFKRLVIFATQIEPVPSPLPNPAAQPSISQLPQVR